MERDHWQRPGLRAAAVAMNIQITPTRSSLGPPAPVRRISGGLGSWGIWLPSLRGQSFPCKSNHWTCFPGLLQSSGSICTPEGRTWLPSAQPDTAVSQGPRRLSLTGMHSPGCSFGRPNLLSNKSLWAPPSPDAMIFTRLGLGDKGVFVHLEPQIPLMRPLPTTHHVPQRLWSTK